MKKVRASIAVLMLLFLSVTPLFAQFASILDANDVDANRTLHATTATGDLTNRQHAEAWVVFSSVAAGMGTEKCNFPRPSDMTFMWKPALDSMSEEEIFTLNRLVTSNFRNAERNGRVLLDRLFPITRQAVISLSDRGGAWNCERLSEVGLPQTTT